MTNPNVFTWPDGKRAAVSLSFDDARLSQPDRGFELLDALGAAATFYISIAPVKQRLGRWKDLVARGVHEIGNHTLTHPCSGNFSWSRGNALEDYTLERMEREILGANDAIAELLGVTPTTFAYPCGQKFVGRGAGTAGYVPLAASHFKVGRGYNDACANDPAFCDPAQVLGVDLDMQPFDLTRRMVDSAIQQGGWLVVVGHDMGDGGYQTVILSELEKLVRYCQNPANGVWLDTIERIGSHIIATRGGDLAMLKVGRAEIDAVASVIGGGKLFRYRKGGQCARFERRYAKFLGVEHVHLTSSGTTALTAALAGLGIGPGMEVLVPAHTYMATAVAVLAVGAIPVIVDVDESLTITPAALDDAIGQLTRAVIPVHMWGLPCDMDAIMKIARRRKLFVVEDACQGVGGAYEGNMLGSIGDAGAFSFNFYKNMTCGEGGAFVTNNAPVARQARCMIDCCSFYWNGREGDVRPFISNGSHASELEGAMLNAQLDRIAALIRSCRRQKRRILRELRDTPLRPATCHSLDYECGTTVAFTFTTATEAEAFVKRLGRGTIAGKTGRHTYNEWDPILAKRGGHHPAMDPFRFPQNRRCRMNYSPDMLPRSLDILSRTVMIGTHPDRTEAEVTKLIAKLTDAATRSSSSRSRADRKA